MSIIEYIFPNIKKIKSKELLNKNDDEYSILYDEHYDENIINGFEDILRFNRVFVVSEPGYGKTKLAQEIFIDTNKKNKKVFILDLKKLDVDKPLDVFLNDNIVKAKNYNYKFKDYDYRMAKSENFKLNNTKDTLIILDSLDEVDKSKFNKVVDYIIDFSEMKIYKNIKIMVTCRTIHILNKIECFENVDFDLLKIDAFSDEQMQDYLKISNFQEEDIIRLKKELYVDDGECIKVPRYLTLLVELKEKGVLDFDDLSKTNIFQKFIDYKLNIETDITNDNDKEIVKRLLEQLALVMEIYQKNQITMDELMTFLIDIRSDLKYYFLNNAKLNQIYSRSILRKTQDGNKEIIEFENVEFQEFLAAKEISRMDNYEQIIFDLSINKKLNEIYPKWYNTLKFLIEKNNNLLKHIIEFGKKNNGIITNNYFQFLVNTDADKINDHNKFLIFETILDYYRKQNIWIDRSIETKISNFFTRDGEKELKKWVDSFNSYNIGNALIIINEILNQKELSYIDQQYWQKQSIRLVENENEVVQRVCIGILGYFNSIDNLKVIFDKIIKDDQSIYESLTWSCIKIDPNDEFSIDIFCEGLKRHYYSAIDGINKINQLTSLKYLLEKFEDKSLFKAFLEKQRLYYKCKKNIEIKNTGIITNIKNHIKYLTKEIKNILLLIVDNEYYYIHNLIFIKHLISVICKHKNINLDYILEIGEYIKWNYNETLIIFSAYLLNEKNIEPFINKTLDKPNNFLLNVLKYSKSFNSSIYEYGREYFEKEYNEIEKNAIEYKQNKKNIDDKIIDRFVTMMDIQITYNTDVYKYILNNREKLLPFIEQNIEYKNKIEKSIYQVFNTFEVENQFIKITERKNDGCLCYSITHELSYLEISLELSRLLKIDISKFREKILLVLPFLYLDCDTEEIINEVINNPTEKEIKHIIDFYSKERIDDLKEVKAGNFINIIKKYDLKELNIILERYVNNAKINIGYRIDAIDILGKENEYRGLIEKIFDTYKDNNKEEYKMALQSNKILIEKYNNEDAIKWRIQRIKANAFMVSERKEGGFISPEEAELRSKKVASPIMKLTDEKHIPIILELLECSFDLLEQDEKYFSYTSYIWDIVCSYYENLKKNGTSKYILELENWYLDKDYKFKDSHWFSSKMQYLKHSYLQSVDKPLNIKKCIKIYNNIVEKNYLEISSEKDILNTLLDILDNDLKKWVEIEGAYRFIEDSSGKQEAMIQKTLVTQFENFLLKKGFRQAEIIREPQNYDDKRPDFVISYGFFGRVVIEIKRGSNQQVTNQSQRKKYLKKLNEYLESNNSSHLIYLIFDTKNNKNFDEHFKKIKEEYSKNPKIFVKALKCIKYNE